MNNMKLDETFLNSLNGLSLEEADKLIETNKGITRIPSEDGIQRILIANIQTNRVNLDIVNNKVVKAHIGWRTKQLHKFQSLRYG